MKLTTKTSVLALLLTMSAGFYAKGEEIGVDLLNDLGAATAGNLYSLSQRGDYYTYTPDETGLITVQTNYDGSYTKIGFQDLCYFFQYDLSWAAGPNVFAPMSSPATPTIVDGGYRFIFNVTAGEKYIFGYGNNLDTPIDFEILDVEAEEIPAVMTYCYPTPGTTFDTGLGINDITLEFDQTLVSVEGTTLDYTNKAGEAVSVPVQSEYTDGWDYSTNQLTIRIAYVNDIFKKAKADADYDYPFYLNFKKVMCSGGPVTSTNITEGQDFVEFSGNGDFKIEYQFMDAVKLVKYNMPTTLYSYYAPGTPEGIATFEFDGPVFTKGAQFIMMMGFHPIGDEGGEDIDPSFEINYSLNEDNTVLTLNFTGINFGEYLEKNYSQATVLVMGLKGENGLVADLNDGRGYLEFFPTYVNSPFEGAEMPDTMDETPEITPKNYSLLRELVDVEVTWSSPVTLVEGLIPSATVALGVNAPQQVPMYIKDGSLMVALSKLNITGNFSGQCEIKIPSGIVKNSEGLVNDALFFAYTLSISGNSSIESVNVESIQPQVIYNLKGEKVDPANAGHGIFIVNGKKVVLK